MTRVHVVGTAGYGAADFVRYALRHPHLELGALESHSHADKPVADHAPMLRRLNRRYDAPGTTLEQLKANDVVLLAGRAEDARAFAPKLLARGARVIDLSDAFRLQAHADGAVYGFPERYRAQIARATFIANPGCYPTATLLALLPLAEFANDIVQLIVDAKSGVTGAGRTPVTTSLFAEVDEDVRAYGFAGHRHEPEISQELDAGGITAPFVFTPQVVPLKRGMLVSAYAVFGRTADARAVEAAYERAYAANPFVRILPAARTPSLVAVAGTNDAEIHLSIHDRVARVLCAIDNLGKGAAGQAMQNLNIMLGFPQETALDDRTVVA
ncbi:MAG TPA: N-acetyl-gamma-glutamyl-phosphate reductase [Candidatus Acidoferrales bacterium]|nr:N-acetyl-gamma-glutamyl-phosphate reductase [Candidatus Acidoferrales bacterium]